MPIVSEQDLAQQAGVDPWDLLKKLRSGDPSQIEELASAFYKAGGHTQDAHDAAALARTYADAGYRVDGAPAIDGNAETALADNHIADQRERIEHLNQIGKLLSGVGSHLEKATADSQTEVDTLNGQLTKIDSEWETFWQGVGHHLPEEDWAPVRQKYIADEVAAVRSSGGIVNKHLTDYETTLASSLKSMADLGYIPPDALDEGPGDVNLDTGNQDGQHTINAAEDGDTTQLQNSMFKLQLINAAIKANGGHVSDAEYAYLYDYYDTTAKHSDVIDNAIKNIPMPLVDANGKALRMSIGAQYADGLLNLSAGSEQADDEGIGPHAETPYGVTYGRGGLYGLPPNLLDVLNSRIGENGPTPDGSTTSSTGGPEILRAVWKDGHWEIPNYANDTGFGDLLSYADKDVAGGTDFSKQLATTAINWKQDIDAIKQNTAAWGALDNTGLPGEDKFGQLTWPRPDGADPFNLAIDDSGASGLLTAASHNQDASTQILLDAGDRHSILGLPWDGHGAADLIESGTAPDPAGTSQRNQAALAVVQDAASNYQDFAKIVSNPVKDALTELAVTHLASFGDPTGPGAQSGVGLIDVPGGQIHGLSLNNTDAADYLKLLSLAGPKYSGVVHAAALDLGAKWLQAGGVGHDSGADHAATLIGRVTSSEYAAAVDKAVGMSGDQQKEYIAEIREQQEEAQKEALQKGVLDGIDILLDVGTSGASEAVKNAVEHFSTAMGAFDTAKEDYSGYVDAGQNTPEQNRLIQLGTDVQHALDQPRESAQVRTQVGADLNYAALKAAGYPDPSLAYTASAGQMSSIVDPALDRYYGPTGGEGAIANQAIDTMTPDGSLAPKPTVDWTAPDVRRAVNGGDHRVYDAQLYQNSMTIDNHLVDVTPK